MAFFEPAVFTVEVIAGAAIAQFKEIEAELTRVAEKSGVAGTSLDSIGSKAILMKAGLAAAGVAAFEFGKVSVEAANNTAIAFASLDTAMKNTGNGSKTAIKDINDVAEAAQNLGFKVPEAADALSTLVTATHNTSDAQHLLGLSMDFARKYHTTLSEAASVMARATQGNAKAFKEMGISLDTTLPKQQAINKAFTEAQTVLKNQNESYLKTFPGQLSVIGAQFESVAASIGKTLIPVLTALGEAFSAIIKFIKDNQDALKALMLIVSGAVIVWKSYEAIILVVNAIQKIQIALALASAEGIGAMRAAMLLLNDAMRANLIGIIVTALIAVSALFVEAWKHSETFRDVVKKVMDAVITFIANTIRAFGGLIQIILNIVTGPLQLFLKVFSALGFGPAKEGLKLVREGINGVGDIADAVANKVEGLKKSIDKLGAGGTTPETKTKTADSGAFNLKSYTGANTKAIAAAKAAAAAAAKIKTELATLNADVKKYYNDMNIVIKDAYDQQSKALTDKNTRDEAAQATFQDTMFKATRTFNDDLFKLNRDSADRIANIWRTYNDAIAAADKTYADAKLKLEQSNIDALAAIDKTYADAKLAAEKKNTDALAAIQQTYQDAVTSATQAAVDQRQAIIQKSIDLLVNAFQSATNVDIGSLFASMLPVNNTSITNALFNQVKNGVTASVSWWGQSQSAGIDGLIASMQTKLLGAQTLASDAAKLAAMGYSQTFIQQVVSQGSVVGDQMAQAIFNASPASQAQLKTLFNQLQTVSATGVTALATQMSTGTSLATAALTAEYANVQTTLDAALAKANTAMQDAQAKQAVTFSSELAAAAQAQTDAQVKQAQIFATSMADLLKAQQDSYASAAQTRNNALADEATAYKNSLQDLNTALSNATFDAQATLKKALADSLTAYNTQIDTIVADTIKKLVALQDQLAATAAKIKTLAGASAGVAALAGSPAAGYIAGTGGTLLPSGGISNPGGAFTPAPNAPTITVTNNVTTTATDTTALTNATLGAISLGTPSVLSSKIVKMGVLLQ